MNKAERLDYIFGSHPNRPVPNRFGWLEDGLIGDIQTFVDGINDLVSKKRKPTKTKPRGGGNVSLPIPVNTALELASSLYVGKTKYNVGNGYNATENVVQFIQHFFQGNSKRIPRILWDSTRNGITHLFTPKSMKRKRCYIHFTFYVDDRRVPSSVSRNGQLVLVKFNSIEFYRVVTKAISRYRKELQSNRLLQINFMKAWRSIEKHKEELDHDPTKAAEADFMIESMKKTGAFRIFG